MAYPLNVTNTTDLDSAIPEIWAKELIVEAEKQMFWHNFEGPQGSGAPIIRKDDLTKEPGDQIHVQTLSNLTGAGQIGSNTLVGNEEKLRISQLTITPSRYRHGVAEDKDARQKVNFDIRNAAKGRLAYWLADRLDNLMFAQAITARTWAQFAGDATNYATLNLGDELDASELAKVHTQLTFNRALPIRVGNGYQLYCIVIHPYDAHYLQTNTADLNWSDVHKYAGADGEMNPLFTGALGVLNGVIVKESHNINYAASKTRSIAFGGEAFASGYSQLPDWSEEEYDYGQQWGVATSVSYGTSNAVQANVVELDCFATAVTD